MLAFFGLRIRGKKPLDESLQRCVLFGGSARGGRRSQGSETRCEIPAEASPKLTDRAAADRQRL